MTQICQMGKTANYGGGGTEVFVVVA